MLDFHDSSIAIVLRIKLILNKDHLLHRGEWLLFIPISNQTPYETFHFLVLTKIIII